MEKVVRTTHSIDATDRPLGRLATEIAGHLMGKNKASYVPHWDMGDSVEITNPDKVRITGKKLDQKLYRHHSGYPGGLKEKKMKFLFAEDPAEVIRKAVFNMLPKNKLRNERMKRLIIKSE